MTEEYIPTTEEVRKHYTYIQPGSARAERDFHCGPRDRDAEFDRWLAENNRKVAEAAWSEGYTQAARDHCDYSPTDECDISSTNPYAPND